MKDAVKGGFEETENLDLFIGKALHEGEWKIGKVMEKGSTAQGLWVWQSDGGAVNLRQFHLLKYNSSIIDSEYGLAR